MAVWRGVLALAGSLVAIFFIDATRRDLPAPAVAGRATPLQSRIQGPRRAVSSVFLLSSGRISCGRNRRAGTGRRAGCRDPESGEFYHPPREEEDDDDGRWELKNDRSKGVEETTKALQAEPEPEPKRNLPRRRRFRPEPEPVPKRRNLPTTLPEVMPQRRERKPDPSEPPIEIDLPGKQKEFPTLPKPIVEVPLRREIIPRGDDPDYYDRDKLLARLRAMEANMTSLPFPLRLSETSETEKSNLTQVLLELEAIMEGDPRNIVILGTRHCNLLHQRIIELLSYALVLTGNRVFTSGGMGTNFVAIRGALRAERYLGRNETSNLNVILPQRIKDQPLEVQEVLKRVSNVTELKYNDIPLDKASRKCNSVLIDEASELIVFAYHDSTTVLDCADEARKNDKLVTEMYLD
mmetsp:Transcript_36235/g.70415  ORF Transcript_36235/g.70415 Transcript_36235/m.70415 type:complete len:408 (+) Transcript_36235:22-1245(+)